MILKILKVPKLIQRPLVLLRLGFLDFFSGVADLDEGRQAYERQDYVGAIGTTCCDASAQHNLGVMYANGQGVGQDDEEAVKWYFLAAEHQVCGRAKQSWLDVQYRSRSHQTLRRSRQVVSIG